MSYYPPWVLSGIVEDELPWDKGRKMNLKCFLEEYTLHDSYYVGLFYNPAYTNNITLTFQWDPIWLPCKMAPKTSLVKDWPYLFIRIEDVEQSSTWGYKDYDDINRAVEIAEYVEVDSRKLFSIGDVFGGNLQIAFSGDTCFLALDKDGKVLEIGV